jgi:hypothetical protein
LYLEVQIPVNAVARICLPANRRSKVYENGTVLKRSAYLVKDNAATINIGSGSYLLEIR